MYEFTFHTLSENKFSYLVRYQDFISQSKAKKTRTGGRPVRFRFLRFTADLHCDSNTFGEQQYASHALQDIFMPICSLVHNLFRSCQATALFKQVQGKRSN